MGFYLEYFCDGGNDCHGNEEGPQGRTRAEVLRLLKKAGWKRIAGGGWLCPECASKPPNPPYSGIVVVDEADFTRGEE